MCVCVCVCVRDTHLGTSEIVNTPVATYALFASCLLMDE